jgi:putative ABC transport system permease protein
MFLALTNNTMPIKLGDEIRKLSGVQAVAPVQVLMNAQDGIEIVFGIDPKSFDAVSGGFSWHEGAMFKEPKEIVVDDLWANAKSAHVGDTVELLNQKFKVTGIIEHGKGARIFSSMADTGEMTGQVDKVGVFFVKLTDAKQAAAVKEKLTELLPGYKIQDMKDFETLMTSTNIPGLSAFIQAVVVVAVCIGVLVIFLSMYTTITERTREIGILRSLGGSKPFIVSLIFQEATFVCVLGVILGVAFSFVIERILQSIFPTLMIQITPGWIVKASVFAVLSGIIGSLYPSLKAAKQDPVEALAYE